MKKKLNYLLLAFTILSIIACNNKTKKIMVDINNQKAVEDYLQGKWEFNNYWDGSKEGKHSRYRIEIKGNHLNVWRCYSDPSNPFDMSEGITLSRDFTLGSPVSAEFGSTVRYLYVEKSRELSLFYLLFGQLRIDCDSRFDAPSLGTDIAQGWRKTGKDWD